ncbi:beta/alpha barrel domain-containing protein [Tepidibacter formicigenes]|uniref:YceG-like family protein n=1 Tax=Tepidibacter formicigenes DSM 15518 TaxID=1123349 RepID=A0A1M6SIX8_9FIRM|nr:hypothetical protein [Tepidibacter formicigenes]SHK44734.1 hypothetical protein SAMN02744037_02356 [Tepidibacter formicigenes DSM 15518]
MKKLTLTIFVIGFSIGLIVSSSINIINNKNINKKEPEVLNKQELLKNTIKEEKKVKEIPKATVADKPKEEFVTIIIENGYTSQKVADILYNDGLIQHKEDFLTLLKSLNLSSKIRVGEKTIKKGSSILEIINIITS